MRAGDTSPHPRPPTQALAQWRAMGWQRYRWAARQRVPVPARGRVAVQGWWLAGHCSPALASPSAAPSREQGGPGVAVGRLPRILVPPVTAPDPCRVQYNRHVSDSTASRRRRPQRSSSQQLKPPPTGAGGPASQRCGRMDGFERAGERATAQGTTSHLVTRT